MRWLICLLLLPVMVHAHPFFIDSHANIYKIPVLENEKIKGVVGFTTNEGLGVYDGVIIAELVYSPENITGQNGFVQEWVVARQVITNLTFPHNQAVGNLEIEVPKYAPPGNYRLDIYFREGRRYISSYYPGKDTIAKYYFQIENPDAYDVPVLDLLKTNANGLAGSLGPFMDKDSVPLEIWLTDTNRNVNVRVIACPWDDSATMLGAPDPSCYRRNYASDNSPLTADFPLLKNGSWGLRVETLEDNQVTSTAVLRAVRNGTSPRIVEMLPDKDERGYFLKAIVLPNADNSPNEVVTLKTTLRGREGILAEFSESISFDEPVAFESNVDRSAEIRLPVEGFPLWFEISSELYESGKKIDVFRREADWCGLRGFCCLENISEYELQSVPRIK